MRTPVPAAIAACIATLAVASPARAVEPLTVCLNEDLAPLSSHQGGKPDSGFDVELAKAIAVQLDRPLIFRWFESKLEEDSSPSLEANALLSDRKCSLVGGYALTTNSLVVPGVKTAKLPDFEGATREDRRKRVQVGVLAPSRPYIYSPLAVIVGPGATGRKITDIGDLSGLRLVIESGTLGDAILMSFGKGRLIDDVTHLVPGRDNLLRSLERGDFDATLIDLRRFDAWRVENPETRLSDSGYYYPIGVNRGYVGLTSEPALLSAVNVALSTLQANGKIEELGKAAGLTYLPPREPAIVGDIWQQILHK